MKLHVLCDFPQQFKKGATFSTDRGELTIEHYNPARGVVKFSQINSPEEAKRYTNAYLYTTMDETRKDISLDEDEYFWFDIIGLDAYEKGERLGKVKDIQRLPACDYLEIETEPSLKELGFAKSFMIPFLDKFIKDVDLKSKKIELQGAKEILEAS